MRTFSSSTVILVVSALGGCAAAPPADAPSSPSAAGPSSASPEPRRVGGGCTYEDTPGTGTVTAIEDEGSAGPDCKQAKRVTLRFQAKDPAAQSIPMDQSFPLEVGGMAFAPEGCLKAHALAVGTQVDVVRHIITAGTCSPRVYEVTTLSSAEATEQCVAHCR